MLKYFFTLISILIIFNGKTLRAEPLDDFFEKALQRFSKKLSTAPITPDPIFDLIDLVQGSDLSLTDPEDPKNFPSLIQNQIQSQIQNPIIQLVKVKNTPENGFSLDSNVESLHYKFTVGDVPVCGAEIKAHLNQNNTILILGQVPQVFSLSQVVDEDQWPSEEKVKTLANQILAKNKGMEFTQSRRCYTPYKNSLVPSWELIGLVHSEAFKILGNEKEIMSLERLQFDVTGKTSTYARNPNDSTLTTYELDMVGDHTLTSEFFTTNTTSGSKSVPRAKSETNDFIYATDAPEFPEVSVFTHATLQYQFFKTLGYSWHGAKPLGLFVHAVTGSSSSTNNAMYQPGIVFQDGRPRILVGDGDGNLLQNLALDADVVSHEFGHHIIYKTLTSTTGESLVLHEGLADFFAFSHSGDPCLGRSICPASSTFCVVPGQCLRTADNDLVYKSDEYLQLTPHLKGQLISGTMWDLRTTLNDGTYVTKMVYNALAYLVSDSGIRDLLFAVLYADDVKSGSKNSCAIFDEFSKRGFDPLLKDAKCNTKSSWPTLTNDEDKLPLTPTPEESKKKDTGLFGCGSIGGFGPTPPDQRWLIFLILLLPAFLPIIAMKLRRLKSR